LCATIATSIQAQNLEVKRIERNGDNLILYYNLTDTVIDRSYTVNLYSSRDNFLNPLAAISGDKGMEVTPGISKKLVWNAKQDLGAEFSDKISIELRARIYIPFIRFDAIEKIKRGKPTEVTWRGGTPQNILNFELYRNGKKVDVIPNIANVSHTQLTLPVSVKPGKGYIFRIVDSKNKDQVVETPSFRVKRKVPLGVKLLPVLALGGALYIFGSSSTSNKEIPGPPDTP